MDRNFVEREIRTTEDELLRSQMLYLIFGFVLGGVAVIVAVLLMRFVLKQ